MGLALTPHLRQSSLIFEPAAFFALGLNLILVSTNAHWAKVEAPPSPFFLPKCKTPIIITITNNLLNKLYFREHSFLRLCVSSHCYETYNVSAISLE